MNYDFIQLPSRSPLFNMFSLVPLIGSFRFDAIETLQHNIITIVYSRRRFLHEFSVLGLTQHKFNFHPEAERQGTKTNSIDEEAKSIVNLIIPQNLFQCCSSNFWVEPLVAMEEGKQKAFQKTANSIKNFTFSSTTLRCSMQMILSEIINFWWSLGREREEERSGWKVYALGGGFIDKSFSLFGLQTENINQSEWERKSFLFFGKLELASNILSRKFCSRKSFSARNVIRLEAIANRWNFNSTQFSVHLTPTFKSLSCRSIMFH